MAEESASVVPLLAAFDSAAREGHITRAADRLGVPQSSVSRRIKTLEQILGVALFQHIGRGVAPTTAGRELHERTRDLVRQLDLAISAVRAHADPDGGTVRFGFPLTLGPVSVPSLLAGFHRNAPGVRLHLTQAHGHALAEMVRDGRLDLAVIIPPPDDLPVTVLGRQELVLHVAESHRLARRKKVALTELADEYFIANPPSYHARSELDSWCAEAGFVPYVAFEITEFDTVRSLVAHDLGVALLPRAEVPTPGVHTIPVDGTKERTIALATGTGELPPAVERLHRHIVTHARRALG